MVETTEGDLKECFGFELQEDIVKLKGAKRVNRQGRWQYMNWSSISCDIAILDL
jgi:hypothetical protein